MDLEIVIRLTSIAILIEALADTFKPAIEGTKIKWEWVTMAIGMILCPLMETDLFEAIGMLIKAWGIEWLASLIGQVLTGAVVSRGADFIMTLWGQVSKQK